MIKEWLIRKLGGSTYPDVPGFYRILYKGGYFTGQKEDVIDFLSSIPLPKSANVTQNVTEIPSLCNNCDATAAECQEAIRHRDNQNRTFICDKWRSNER